MALGTRRRARRGGAGAGRCSCGRGSPRTSRAARLPGRHSPAAMVGRFVDARDDGTRNPAAAMAFLFDDTDVRHGLPRRHDARPRRRASSTQAGDEPELRGRCCGRDHGPDPRVDPQPGARRRRRRQRSSELLRGSDPMYALLETIATNGDAGRTVFTDDRVAGVPLRAARRASSTACAAWRPPPRRAAAGPDVVVGASPGARRRRDSWPRRSSTTSAARPATCCWEFAANDAVSRSAATILGQHLFAVHNAVLRARTRRSTSQRGDLVEIADQTRGDGTIASGAPVRRGRPRRRSPTWPSTRPTAWRRCGRRSTSTSRPRRRLGVGRIADGELAGRQQLPRARRCRRRPPGGLLHRPRRAPGRGQRALPWTT